MLIFFGVDILMVKFCDLKKVFDFFGLDVKFFCVYSLIKDLFIVIIIYGVIMLVVNLILFLVIFCDKKLKKLLFIVVSIINIFNIIIFNVLIICINILYLMIKCKFVYSLLLL